MNFWEKLNIQILEALELIREGVKFIFEFFLKMFKKDNTLKLDAPELDALSEAVFYKKLAVFSAVNLIARTLTRAEFLTFEGGIESIKNNHYILNVEPNPNMSASKFWTKAISKMLLEDECLIIQQNDHLYIADSFDVQKYAFVENKYSNIVVENYTLKDVFNESQVFHLESPNVNFSKILDALCQDYLKLVAASQKIYKKGSLNKGTLELETQFSMNEKTKEQLDDLLDNRFRAFFNAERDAVLPLQKGVKYNDIKSDAKAGRDTRAFIDDIFDFVAISLNMPPIMLKGGVADTSNAVNDFLAFCIKPIAGVITDEFNRKLYGKKMYLEKTYCKLDTTRIKVVDLKDVASSLDILTRIGANTINDSLRSLDRETLSDGIATKRFMTKNYDLVENFKSGEANNGNSNKKTVNKKGGDTR